MKVRRKVKLTDKDKSTISNNLNVCTDSHGRGCTIAVADKKEKDRKLN